MVVPVDKYYTTFQEHIYMLNESLSVSRATFSNREGSGVICTVKGRDN